MTAPTTEPLPARQIERLTLGAEGRGLEFKQSMDWEDVGTRLNLIRTFMAMSNNRDGGAVVVGVRENPDGTYTPVGMTQDHYDSLDPDNIAAETARYADPAFDLSTVKGLYDGRLFAVIEIRASIEVPTVCKTAHGGSNVLRQGAVYVRPTGMPRTEEIHTYREMRDIIDQAVERRIERFRELGLLPMAEPVQPASHRDALDAELGDLL